MISPYKKILVYDLETGGFSSSHNQITEIAIVAIDLETLEIADEFSTLIKPWLNLTMVEEEPIREARELFKMLKEKDTETGLNILEYNGHMITLKNLEPLVEDIKTFYIWMEANGSIIDYETYLQLEEREDLGSIAKLYFDKSYNPQALEVTGISRELMVEEGVDIKEAFELIQTMIKKHTVGNSKPILAGHNIKKFDNPFLEKLFEKNGANLHKVISDTQMIDTLEWARLRWFELSSFALGVCANEVGLTLKGAHRALADTISNAQFLVKLLKGLRGEGAQSSKYKRKKYNFNF